MRISIALSFSFLAGLPLVMGAQSGLPAPAVTAFRPVAPVRSAAATPRAKAASAGSTYGSNTGWGSVANPGTGHPPNTTPSGIPKNSYNTGTGRRRNSGAYLGSYAYPVYIPGYADSVTANPYVGNPGDQQFQSDRPPVVIQNFYPSTFVPPQQGQQQMGPDDNMQTYVAPSQAPIMQSPADTAVNSGNYYLIAYKDHHIYSALAYWMEGNTVHYVTTQNTHNQVPLDAVDIELTKRLNQDRNITLTAGQ